MARRGHSTLRRSPSGTVTGVRASTLISRLMFIVGFGAVIGVLGGFVWFADHVTSMKPGNLSARVDGAVVLTGGSNERLKAGIALLENKRADRLLISGVNKDATREELRLVTGGQSATWACCVDIGKQALDTVGNAREIEEWTASNRMTKIVLVTDNYHLPRSLMEVRRAVPSVTIVPYPIVGSTYHSKDWWGNERASRGLALEYGKYLVANMRALFLGLDGQTREEKA